MAIQEDIGAFLAANADEGYRAFQAKLIPNIDAATIVGVRTPELRKFAKGLARREDAGEFLAALPHGTFEENQLHSFVIAQERDFDKLVGEIERFLPFVDNWATCDQLSCRGLAANPDAALAKARAWLESDHEYTVRFAIGVLMELFLPFLLYLGAEAIHVSGILSVVAAGLIIRFDRSGVGPNVARTNIVASSVWSVLSFALNGAVFILLGMLLPDAMEASWNDQQISNLTLLATILIVAAVVVGMRFAWVAAMLRITRHEVTRERRRMTKERWRSAAVMTFGGPKGTITLSLMFTIPYTLADGEWFPMRDELIFIAGGVIVVTLLLANFLLPVVAPKRGTDDSRAITEASIEVLRRTVEELAERVTPDNRRAVMAVIDSYTKRITRLKHRLGAIDPIGFSELQIAALEWEKDYVKGRLAATKAQTGEQSVDRDLEIEACERLLDQIMTSLRHAVTDHDSAHAIWQIKGRMRSLQRRIKILSSRVNNLIRKNTPMLSEHQIYAHMRTVQTAAIDNVIDHLYDEMGKSTYNTEYCSALLLDYRRAEATLKARPNMGATTEMITQIEEIKRESYGIELSVIQDMLEADDITRSQARQLRKNVYVMSVAADSSI